ncbi:sugar transferase [Pseudahrensia aquimaris]|uniref:Sugar transferase n=1 Tax=Pseudahrensia aquimaris TaxID=744461 RepID=A0ABW3FHK0_9HYPH
MFTTLTVSPILMVILSLSLGVFVAYEFRHQPTIGRYESFLLYVLFMSPLSFSAYFFDFDETYAIVPSLLAWFIVVLFTKRATKYGVLGKKGYLRCVLMNRRRGRLVRSADDLDKIDKLILDEKFLPTDDAEEEYLKDIFQKAALLDVELLDINDFLKQEYGYVNYMRKSHRIALRERVVFDTLKNAFDRTLSLVLLIVFLPLFAIISLAIYLQDGGPVIFWQTRVGKGGRHFEIAKFRSLKNGDDETPIGRKIGTILRVSHFDELPQLWNVLKGDMALVGPRPEWLSLATDQKAPKGYWMRTAIRPGITGWAQVSYKPSRTLHTRNRKLGYDIFYINNRGIFLDALVWLRTFQKFGFFLVALLDRKSRSKVI